MEEADLLIAVGTRAVCQADCSGTGYPKAEAVININGELADAAHYNRTLMLTGDIGAVIERWLEALGPAEASGSADWRRLCGGKKREWQALKDERCGDVALDDPAWGRAVLTQPSAVATVARFAGSVGAIKLFDAGDVQANGFQIVEDDRPGETYTEAGASYMGFAVSALLASAAAKEPRPMIAFTGDGSFFMNPQILVDAVVHGVKGTIVVFDNRRMGAISSLQSAQYGPDFATNDAVAVDYVALAQSVGGVKGFFGGSSTGELEAALQEAHEYNGLSLVHVPVYWGHDPRGGMGAYGRWNVGPWCEEVERIYAGQAL
jgi:3D-(3,5/4)-trihydroxycyclohexane-1,2-dione acylhydrolase (decyclizing)